VPHWKASHGGPDLYTVNGNQYAFFDDPAGIYTSCNFEAGKTYRIQFKRGTNANLYIKAANGLTPNNASLPTVSSQLIKHFPLSGSFPYTSDYLYFTPSQNYSQLWIYNTAAAAPSITALVDDISVLQCGGYSADFTQTACKENGQTKVTCSNNDVFTTQNLWEVYESDTAPVTATGSPVAVATGNDPVIIVSTAKRYLLVRHIVNNSGCTADVKTAVIDRNIVIRCGVNNDAKK
jgi:hypothetical protein